MTAPQIIHGDERELVGNCPLCGRTGTNVYRRLTMFGVTPEYYVLTDLTCPIDGQVSIEAAAP
jgi:hypothetical protein